MKYKTLVVRGDQDTVAIIDADVSGALRSDTAFFAALVRAVTEWVKNTCDGKAAWERSCQDFNVGDLSGELSDLDLQRYLEEEGIKNLGITVHNCSDGNMCWTYDTVLVDEDKLEEEQ